MPGYPDESFAYYLPDTDPGAAGFPVLFVFDPAARGRLGVAVFEAAAKENGWAVFCSNGSRNGSFQRNFEVAQRLIDHSFKNFPLDNEQIYTAGFSGGARLAGAIAVLSGSIKGVIGCGASFAQNTNYFPAPGANFVWAGIVGNKDMNYQELLQAEGWLTSISLPHRLFFFDGRHRWPPQDAILRATRYIKFATTEAPGKQQGEAALSRELALADSLELAEDLLGTVRTLRGIQSDFPASRLPDDFALRVHTLASSSEYKKQQQTWEKITEEEEGFWANLFQKFKKELKAEKAAPDTRWWNKQRNLLEERYQESEDPQLQNMAARIKNRLFAGAIETSDPFKNEARARSFGYCSRLLVTFFPNYAYSWVREAEARMLLKEPDQAVEDLKKAAELGLNAGPQIRANPLFAGILKHPQFPFPLN